MSFYIDDQCQLEVGWVCSGGDSTTADTCEPICGDGLKFKGERCDDGNLADGDGCTSI